MNLHFLGAMSSAKIAAIVGASIFGVLLIISLIIALANRESGVAYDKDGFVHKVLKHDFTVFNQVARLAELVFFIPAVVFFFLENIVKYNYWISLGLLIAAAVVEFAILVTKIMTKFSRIEYNRKGLYKFSFGAKQKFIEWKEVKNVKSTGVGRDRKFIFESKKEKIVVPFKMVGAYEFTVFCEEQLDGEQFEAIKMGKARQ